MKECVRCKTKMVDTYINKRGKICRLIITAMAGDNLGKLTVNSNDNFFKNSFEENVDVYVCPNCGEISLSINPNNLVVEGER